jgi:hypothetical protein
VALPPRVYFSLYEASVRWDCSISDIAGWASQGKLKIMTGIGLVRCGDAMVAGTVTLSPMDLLPLFRRSGPGPTEGVMQRILPPDASDWLIITDPPDGVPVTVADMLIHADEHDLIRKAAAGANGGQPYDWAGMNIALIRRIHDQGLPATQAELIAEMQDWFADQTGGARIPDSRSIRRRITPVWHELRREGA